MFMRRVFTRPDRLKESLKRYVVEISKLGVDSIPLVIVISLFIGAVIAIQMQINFPIRFCRPTPWVLQPATCFSWNSHRRFCA